MVHSTPNMCLYSPEFFPTPVSSIWTNENNAEDIYKHAQGHVGQCATSQDPDLEYFKLVVSGKKENSFCGSRCKVLVNDANATLKRQQRVRGISGAWDWGRGVK